MGLRRVAVRFGGRLMLPLVGIALLQGCCLFRDHVPPPPPPYVPPPPPPYVPPPPPYVPPAPPYVPPPVDTVSVSGTAAAQEDISRLNVSVVSSASGSEVQPVALQVQKSIVGRLTAAGYTIDLHRPDLGVTIEVSSQLLDRSGSFYLYQGVVDASVAHVKGGKLLGRERVACKGERKLGKGPAIESLVEQLARDSAEWVASVTTPEKVGLAASLIQVQRNNLRGTRDAVYAANFVEIVNGENGVVSCELKDQDYGLRIMTFRVVYYRKSFPAGLLNTLTGMKELDMKPVN